MIINRDVQSSKQLLGRLNGAPVDGKAITDPIWKRGALINATMKTTAPLGGLDDIKMVQESMIKVLEHVNQGHNVDYLT